MRRSIPTLLFAVAVVACVPGGESSLCSEAAEASALAVVFVEVAGEQVCLGTAVAASWIVTAKHCVQPPGIDEPIAPELVRVRDGDGSVVAIAELVVPGGAYESLGELSGHDIALLRRASGASREPVPPSEALAAAEDEACVVLADDVPAPTLVRIHAVESRAIYVDGVTCPGDSGGPLLAPDGGILGVASWRTLGECGRGTSVFTRVDVQREWMHDVIGE